ncbi:MAG: hypothetical protein ACREA7_01175 [Nitrosotalea sp.]
MDAKILLCIAVVIVIAVIAAFAFLPGTGIIRSLVPQNANLPSSLTAISSQVIPLSISYNGTSILNTSEKTATLQTNFYVTNPNNIYIILEYINYDISDNGTVIGHGQIGQAYEKSWQGSDYYPLISGTSSNMGNSVVIENTGNYPAIWSELEKGTAKIVISGTAHYATKNAFSGSDYAQDFNFTKA